MRLYKGQLELDLAGFLGPRALGTQERLGGPGSVTRPARYGRWFEAMLPHGQRKGAPTELVLILRQSANCWHVFGSANWTASHSNVEHCHEGGLGDAISTDSEMRTYKRLVAKAPVIWCATFNGLWSAKQQVGCE